MNRTYVVAGVIVVAILAAVGGAALYTGAGPASGGDAGETDEEFPTAETSNTSDGSETVSSGDATPFTFSVDGVEECGQTCRDVTATLTNERNETATGVTSYIRIYAGENNTDPDDVVWEGTVDVGTLEAGASETTTERIELSLGDALEIDQNGGWITIQTTVESDDTTVTDEESRQVA